MRLVHDYLRDGNNNYQLAVGDFASGESTAKHQRDLILHNKGDYKQNPIVGVGAPMFIDDEGPGEIIREISSQFMADGMTVTDITPNPASVTDSTVKVIEKAYYK